MSVIDGNEYMQAVDLANHVLERINADPDEDLAILARQFLRANERLLATATNPSRSASGEHQCGQRCRSLSACPCCYGTDALHVSVKSHCQFCKRETSMERVRLLLRVHRLSGSDLVGWYGRCMCDADFETEDEYVDHMLKIFPALAAPAGERQGVGG